MVTLKTLDDLDVAHKRVLCRIDLNVPMHLGRIEDTTRIDKVVPTILALIKKQAKVILLSHFGRPGGQYVRDMSLAPLVDALSKALGGKEVKFAVDCVGESVVQAVSQLHDGEVLLLENLRFHEGEETNDKNFAKALADLGECYVGDTFSCAHREHASIVGIPHYLPSAAGLLLQAEIEHIENVLSGSDRPMTVLTGGSKISTKLALLTNLLKKCDHMVIGGAMANTFLVAQGFSVGTSLYEPALVEEAKSILKLAEKEDCQIILPDYVVVAPKLDEKVPTKIVPVSKVPDDMMILDIGPAMVGKIAAVLKASKTVVWNGPFGAYETRPFDIGTLSVARTIASLTDCGGLISLAGGGDVVAGISIAGVADSFTYVSTAGGAFLEWLEGKELPGVKVLVKK